MGNPAYRKTTPEVRQRARELRSRMTAAEILLWEHLRNRQLGGFKFRRQHPLGQLVVDFYSPACRLVVEIDGEIHLGLGDYDLIGTKQIQALGCQVVRFYNWEVEDYLDLVLKSILSACLDARNAQAEHEVTYSDRIESDIFP